MLCTNAEAIARIVDAVFSDKTPADAVPTTPPPVLVQVQNGTGTDSLAKQVVQFIAAKGYPVDDLNIANAFDGQTHAESEILDLTGTSQATALQIAGWLEIPPEQVRVATADERAAISGDARIVVVLGNDADFATLIKSPTTSIPGG